MRQELVDLIYHVADQSGGAISADGHLYFVILQSLGFQAAASPMGGRSQRIGRDIGNADWHRVYDLIVRLWPEFERAALHEFYREGVNRILAAYGVAWDLGGDGRLYRVLPKEAQAQVEAAFRELGDPKYAPALTLFNAARDAYDDRPRRDRDACANVFDAMESVAKERFGMPHATFGQVLDHIGEMHALNKQIIGVLATINKLRNSNFGHGMTAPFGLTPAEVDFTYLTCIGAILLFARSSSHG
jgi:hypothetical protein